MATKKKASKKKSTKNKSVRRKPIKRDAAFTINIEEKSATLSVVEVIHKESGRSAILTCRPQPDYNDYVNRLKYAFTSHEDNK